MKRFLLFVSLILFSLPIVAAAQTVDFKVKGVGHRNIISNSSCRLGKPLSNRKGGTNPCGGTKRVLRYSGLKITLNEDEEKQNIVVLIEVASPKWEVVSEISVSSSLENGRAKVGQTSELSKERGFDF